MLLATLVGAFVVVTCAVVGALAWLVDRDIERREADRG